MNSLWFLLTRHPMKKEVVVFIDMSFVPRRTVALFDMPLDEGRLLAVSL